MKIMAAADTAKTSIVFFIFMCTCLHLIIHCIAHTDSRYDAIYQFGDSLSDTGNFIRLDPSKAFSPFARLPYGQTYFHKPTGRNSDGRLMIDFLAQELGLPLLKPYLQNDSSHFHHGMNFAVAGATAVDIATLGVWFDFINQEIDISLHRQLDWFFSHLDSICPNETECDKKLEKALFVVGEIGVNDYSYSFLAGKSMKQVKALVPYVVISIKHAIKKLIKRGATKLIVPGTLAMGCLPTYLNGFKTNDSTHYDNTNCLKNYNTFAEYHNKYLKATLTKLSKKNPDVVIVYADYYNAFQSIISSGIEDEYVLRACCGAGGEYNVNVQKWCGVEGASSCSKPFKYISWDGTHYTDTGFKLLFKWMLKNNFSLLKI